MALFAAAVFLCFGQPTGTEHACRQGHDRQRSVGTVRFAFLPLLAAAPGRSETQGAAATEAEQQQPQPDRTTTHPALCRLSRVPLL
jgi:hypothetical protein